MNSEILQAYLLKVRMRSQKIKEETDICFLKYKDEPDLEFRLRDEIQGDIDDFEFEFNMSAPQALMGTIEARICFAETCDIYLDLAGLSEKNIGRTSKQGKPLIKLRKC